MMDTQKILKPNGVLVIADYRERDVAQHLKNMGISVKEMHLPVADFICSENRVAIERKTHSDFVSSIIDGRIFPQAKLLKENFEKPVIIVEGISNRNISENALTAAIATLLVDFNISVLSTKNKLETARTIYWIAKKEQEEKNHSISFKVGKKPKDEKQFKEKIVSSLPGISTVMSKRLLSHFGSVEKVFTADENQLMEVKGIGKKLASKIRKILEENY